MPIRSDLDYPQIVSDGSGGAIIGASLDSSPFFVHRINSLGNQVWPDEGIEIVGAPGRHTTMIADGIGGAWISWVERFGREVKLGHVTSSGMQSERVIVPSGAGTSSHPSTALTLNADGDPIICWEDTRDLSTSSVDLYALRVLDDPLPILFSEFSARRSENGVVLQWELYADEVVLGFRVYRTASSRVPISIVTPSPLDAATRRFLDRSAGSGSYSYHLAALNGRSEEFVSRTITIPESLGEMSLGQNFPNPFNPLTTIEYELAIPGLATVAIYSPTGSLVRKLVSKVHSRPGKFSITWDGLNEAAQPVASGVYYYRLSAGRESLNRKLVYLK